MTTSFALTGRTTPNPTGASEDLAFDGRYLYAADLRGNKIDKIDVLVNGISLFGATDFFQVRYVSNLAIGDSFINITNTGAASTSAFPTQDGNLCVNVYTFSPDEQLISCCTCPVTPNGLASLSARNDLLNQ